MKRALAVGGFSMLGTLVVFCNIQNDKVINSAILAGFIAFLLSLIFKETRKSKTFPTAFAFVILSLVLLSASNQSYADNVQKYNEKEIAVSGYLTEISYKQNGNSYYTIKTDTVNGEKKKLKIRICSDAPLDFEPTDRIYASVKIFLFGNNDKKYINYYKAENLTLGAYLSGSAKIEKSVNYDLSQLILKLRSEAANEIMHILPNDYGAVVTGLVLGDKSDLSERTENAFRFCGVLHLFAVSGLHISVWSMMIFGLLTKMRLSFKKASAVSIIFCLFFMALTGFNPPVVRSGFMMIMIYISNLLNREADAFNSMGLSLIVMLILNPYNAVGLSLQLSVLATSGILTISQPISCFLTKPLHRIKSRKLKSLIYSVISVIGVSISVTVFTIPIYIINFKSVSTLQILSNLIMISVGTVCMEIAGIAAIFCVIGLNFVGTPLLIFSGILSKFLINTAYFLSSFRYSLFPLNTELSTELLLFFMFAGFMMFIIGLTDIKFAKIMCAVFAVVFAAANLTSFLFNFDKLQMSVADVGNGTAVVMTCKGENIIICCGGEYFAESSICDIMNKYGISTVDYLFLPDKAADSSDLLDGYDIRNIYDIDYINSDNQAIETADLSVRTESNFSQIIYKSTSIVIVFSNNTDFKDSKCDILIFKSRFPKGIKYRFAVSSYDENTGYFISNAYSVSENGAISFLIDGNNTVRRVE